MGRVAARASAGVAVGTLVAGCTFGEQAIAPGVERTVVHAVLNPSAVDQYVLVERTLSGRVAVVADSLSDSEDPIVSGGGVPVHGARVEVRDAAGAIAVATETQTSDGPRGLRGTGVYRFENLALPGEVFNRPRVGVRVVPGGRLQLRVQAPDGQVVTGASTVPGEARTPLFPEATVRTLMRDTGALRLTWAPVPGARSYLVRVDSPYGAFFVFTDTAAAEFTGAQRNLFADRLPRVFIPGFTQWLTVAAIDTNFFDYYRSGNSPFTGSGLINRLDGGLGLFGAYVPVLSTAVVVRAEDRDPFDGRYDAQALQGREILRLWVDGRSGNVAEVNGAYRLQTEEQYGLLGTLDGNRLRLRAVESADGRVVNRFLEGEVRGDTLLLQLRGAILPQDDGRRVFVRQRTAP
jgi:hypothetical protein